MDRIGKMFRNLFLGVALVFVSCTDAQCARRAAFGSEGHITCYSGGKITFDGDSTGQILSEEQSDGWFFKDKKTSNLIRVSGDCVITN